MQVMAVVVDSLSPTVAKSFLDTEFFARSSKALVAMEGAPMDSPGRGDFAAVAFIDY